ncbi:OLC1v1007655C1 [Oldenlandia corymbosa var. corymbosa]|uniref:OLC1v1007655C1 n=1 Tax=Oldenlandia corymbosa var. corymbosa TaxID=529605 RepID=A0AAV1DJP5_OLDCO|nr:OLC1v1007655C1 [Oldenlandia corymbosa var. corymbosa]
MDALVEPYLATFNYYSVPQHLNHIQNDEVVRAYNYVPGSFEDYSDLSNGSPQSLVDASSPSSSSDAPHNEQGDPSDPMLKFISQMLMEEDDLANKPCMLHDSSALQAAEKSFYDVLNEPGTNGGHAASPSGSLDTASSDICTSSGESNWVSNQIEHDYQYDHSSVVTRPSGFVGDLSPESIMQSNQLLLSSTNSFLNSARERDESLMNLIKASSSNSSFMSPFNLVPQSINNVSSSDFEYGKRALRDADVVVTKVERNSHSPAGSSTKKSHSREDSSPEEIRSSKQLASSSDDVPQEMYDNVLLCPGLNPHIDPDPFFCESEKPFLKDEAIKNHPVLIEKPKGSSRGRPRGGKRQGAKKEVVDLRGILVQCAQAVASYDVRTTNELLARIRQHASPHGDGMERLAHYFAIALEARLAGTGTALYTDYRTRRISAFDILKGYKMLVAAVPIKKVSNIFANKTIGKLVAGASRIHIIDFGILYGFQWPCLIQRLSMREGGPPNLRITGIDLPQPGLRPAERVEETGRRLEKYCERFGVPFKYEAIAKRWDTIKIEDFKIDRDEVLVVNCMDRLANVPDETVVENCPRDQVLSLIKKIRPNVFIQSVINGTYNSPFFVTRFREALFHFSSLFDMFDATILRESEERALCEQEILARDALNVIACEGTERVERPETYKQWQVRNMRAGFRQMLLDQEIVKHIRDKVKDHYHRDFSVDEDGKWMLQGWKGRVVQAISCWEPLPDEEEG